MLIEKVTLRGLLYDMAHGMLIEKVTFTHTNMNAWAGDHSRNLWCTIHYTIASPLVTESPDSNRES